MQQPVLQMPGHMLIMLVVVLQQPLIVLKLQEMMYIMQKMLRILLQVVKMQRIMLLMQELVQEMQPPV